MKLERYVRIDDWTAGHETKSCEVFLLKTDILSVRECDEDDRVGGTFTCEIETSKKKYLGVFRRNTTDIGNTDEEIEEDSNRNELKCIEEVIKEISSH